MWTAGDQYFSVAKTLLDSTYASSMPSTVQSLLLLGYRELGIGAMAQAWVYTGMAVRMAQDLGMHRAADGWARADVGRLFGPRELQERRRIWWGCVVLDGYVSTYIGRPLAIFERDYDTLLPGEDEVWKLFQSGFMRYDNDFLKFRRRSWSCGRPMSRYRLMPMVMDTRLAQR